MKLGQSIKRLRVNKARQVQSLFAQNVKNMKCTGLKAVSYPDARPFKGSTVQKCTDTRIFYIWC